MMSVVNNKLQSQCVLCFVGSCVDSLSSLFLGSFLHLFGLVGSSVLGILNGTLDSIASSTNG